MVKVGFICEGATETRLIASTNFIKYLQSISIEVINVIDAKGSGNLLPHNIDIYIKFLENAGATKIIILTDLDDDINITNAKNRIKARETDIVVFAVKQIESWFLANNAAMKILLKDDNFIFETPENEDNPFETIKQLMLVKTGRGIGNKILLVDRLINQNFQLEHSAMHSNCKSVTYFINKLSSI